MVVLKMSGGKERKDFFISRTSADKDWAAWIGFVLEEVGYSVHLQDWDFRPGTSFVSYMQWGAIRCAQTLAVLSSDYFNRSFCAMEWEAALARDPAGVAHALVTVRVRECEPSGLLSRYQYIDLVGLDEAAARRTLLEGVAPGRSKPAVRSPFPPGRRRPAFPGDLPRSGSLHRARRPCRAPRGHCGFEATAASACPGSARSGQEHGHHCHDSRPARRALLSR